MDPLGPPRMGEASPFLDRFDTTNTALEMLRQLRQSHRGKLDTPPREVTDLNPAVRVWVRNDTGGTLLPLSCVKLGDPIISAVDHPHTVRRGPVFKGETPDDADNAFAIVEDGAGGGSEKLLRAVVLGTTVCDVNFSDEDHEYAEPEADSTTLASAAAGPARILKAYGSGTGVRRCVVLIDRGGAAKTYTAVVTDASDDIAGANQDTTITLTIPTAGDWMLHANMTGLVNASALSSGVAYIVAQWRNDTDAANLGSAQTVVCATVTGASVVQGLHLAYPVTTTGSTDFKLRFSRLAGPTYTLCRVNSIEMYGVEV